MSLSNIVTFKGEENEWFAWSVKFVARATLNNYQTILDGTVKAPSEDKKTSDKDELAAHKKIQIAYCEFLLAMENQRFLDIVMESRTSDLPQGDAYLSW